MNDPIILNANGKKSKVIVKEILEKVQRAAKLLAEEKIGFFLVCLECKTGLRPDLSCQCSERRILE